MRKWWVNKMAEVTNNEEVLENEVIEENIEEAAEVTEEANLEQQLAEANAQLEELNQRFLRVSADFDNYRKRTMVEKEELAKYANANLVSELLPVLDTFQMGLQTNSENTEVQNFQKGMTMIYRNLMEALKTSGLQEIEAVGQKFDPNKHEAVMNEPAEGVEDDTIIAELRVGYAFKDKVIRPTMVKVAQN